MSVRWLGILLFVGGGAGTAWATRAAYAGSRPRDLAFAVLAPVALLLAVTGLVLAFVPGFLG
jgi:hypothetical protein